MIVYGTGGIAIVAVEMLSALDINVSGFYDDDQSIKFYQGLDVLSAESRDLLNSDTLVCISDNTMRQRLVEQYSCCVGPFIHPTCIVSSSATIGNNSMVFQSCCIQASASLGVGVIVNTSASIDHDCIISDFVHIAPRVTLCGGVSVGVGANIGANTVVIPNVVIGKQATIGAGAVVIRDVPPGAKVVGNPGRII